MGTLYVTCPENTDTDASSDNPWTDPGPSGTFTVWAVAAPGLGPWNALATPAVPTTTAVVASNDLKSAQSARDIAIAPRRYCAKLGRLSIE
jgi:hypothetical protein